MPNITAMVLIRDSETSQNSQSLSNQFGNSSNYSPKKGS